MESGLIPRKGDLEFEIPGSNSTVLQLVQNPMANLQRLHWGVIENLHVWPADSSLSSVGVSRSILECHNGLKSMSSELHKRNHKHDGKNFNILIVVAQPGRKEDAFQDLDHQILSESLVEIAGCLSSISRGLEVSLKILRPPTWANFEDHLQELSFGHYDSAHFDMHGEVKDPLILENARYERSI